MKHKVDNIIFWSGYLDLRAGGPMGYIANLKLGLEKNNTGNIKIISRSNLPCMRKRYETAIRILTGIIPFKVFRKRTRESLIKYFNVSQFYEVSLNSTYYRGFSEILDQYEFKTITCHWVKDALFIRNYLAKRKNKAKLILMSHSPEPPSEEVMLGKKSTACQKLKKTIKFGRILKKKRFAKRQTAFYFLRKNPLSPIRMVYHILKRLLKKSNSCFFQQDVLLLLLT